MAQTDTIFGYINLIAYILDYCALLFAALDGLFDTGAGAGTAGTAGTEGAAADELEEEAGLEDDDDLDEEVDEEEDEDEDAALPLLLLLPLPLPSRNNVLTAKFGSGS